MKRLLALFFTLAFVGIAQENNYSIQISGFTNAEYTSLANFRAVPDGNDQLFVMLTTIPSIRVNLISVKNWLMAPL